MICKKPFDNNAFYQYLAGFSATLAMLSCGMNYGWPAPSLPKLLDVSSPIQINENIGYWLIVSSFLGAVLGDLTTPLLVDTVGRHKTILITSIPYLVCWLMLFFAKNYQTMLAGRFIGGVSCGLAFCTVPIYIAEISEPRIRGLLGVSLSMFSVGGMLLIDIIGSYCSVKMTALISCSIPITMVAIFIFMPESPYFLIMKGKSEAAKETLKILRGTEDVTEEIIRIERSIREDVSKTNNPLDLISTPSSRKAIIILMSLRVCTECSGDAAINFYAQSIFKESGSDISEQLASIIFFSMELIVTGVAAGLVDRSGRRPLLIFSAADSIISLMVVGFYFYFKVRTTVDLSNFTVIPLVAALSFVVCSSAGLKVMPLLMVGELLPPNIKAKAACVNDMFGVAVILCVTKFFQITRDRFGLFVPFLSFGVFSILGLVFIIFCVPETKSKTLEEIQEYLRGNTKTPDINIYKGPGNIDLCSHL